MGGARDRGGGGKGGEVGGMRKAKEVEGVKWERSEEVEGRKERNREIDEKGGGGRRGWREGHE